MDRKTKNERKEGKNIKFNYSEKCRKNIGRDGGKLLERERIKQNEEKNEEMRRCNDVWKLK